MDLTKDELKELRRLLFYWKRGPYTYTYREWDLRYAKKIRERVLDEHPQPL